MAERATLQLTQMAADRYVGTEVGGYRVVEPLGRGGTSVVYRAEHVRLGRPAALKLLTPGLGEADFRTRFLRESQLVASLDHPSIVPVYDAGEAPGGVLYIAMACVEENLKALLEEEGPLPVRRTLRILGQVGSALDAAHQHGLVHRDVKPANILVGPDDRAYLSDFGVAKDLSTNGTTRTGTFVGTIDYCAPEQIEGKPVDARTDVYALACVLHECLTGEAPFHRPSEVAVLNAHLHAPPPKLTRAAPGVPQALEHVVAKALSKSPLDRYASCGEFLAAARAAAAEPRVYRRRLATSIGVLLLALAVGAGAALGIRALVDGGGKKAEPPAKPKPSLASLLLRSNDARTLNDIGYTLIGAHAFRDALPFERKAVLKATHGTLTEAYSTFNLGLVLLKLGRCRESLVYLRRALPLEPPDQRPYVQRRIKQAERCVQRAASAPAQTQ
jgi:serine/threonine protein kinase